MTFEWQMVHHRLPAATSESHVWQTLINPPVGFSLSIIVAVWGSLCTATFRAS